MTTKNHVPTEHLFRKRRPEFVEVTPSSIALFRLGEQCNNCPTDCPCPGTCSGGGICCGNGTCEFTEDCENCADDCGGCCGNETCEDFEDCSSCLQDCPCPGGWTCVGGECVTRMPDMGPEPDSSLDGPSTDQPSGADASVEGDGAAEAGVLGAVDDAHTTLAEPREDLVVLHSGRIGHVRSPSAPRR